MSNCVVGRHDSQLNDAVAAASLRNVVAVVPNTTTLVVPTSAHAEHVRRLWAELRPGELLPECSTMASLTRSLYKELASSSAVVIDDVEAELLLDIALNDCNESFRPPGLSVDAIVRWKQELLTVQVVEQTYLDEDMPRRLAELNRILPVWKAYERRKSDRYLDRGDVLHNVIDALAVIGERLSKRTILIYLTHGLTLADRTVLHLLSSLDWDVAIRFASIAESNVDLSAERRSLSAMMWLVAHGWTQVHDDQREPSCSQFDKQWNSKREEIRRTLAAIKEWMAGGIAREEICIILPSSGSYDEQFIDTAQRAGVPLSLTERQPLRHNGYATALLSACHTVTRGWTRADVDRLTSSGFVSFGTLPVARLSNAASRARIIGGDGWKAWNERFDETLQLLTEAVEHDPEDETIQQNIALVRDGKTIINWLANTLNPTSDVMTAARFGTWLRESVIHGLGMTPPQELLSSIDVYRAICDRQLGTTRTLSEHVSSWWDVVASIDVIQKISSSVGITVCKPHETRGRAFRRVIALGFIDGELPARKKDVVYEELLSGLRESVDVETYSDIINACTDDGILIRSTPIMEDGKQTVQSVFWGSNIENCGTRALDDTEKVLLLDVADARAYRDGTPLNTAELQHGLQIEQLNGDVQQHVRMIADHPISPSRVDVVTQCPYLFYVQNILGIKKETTEDIALSPIERGSLLHAVVQEFFKRVRGVPQINIVHLDDVRASFVDLTTRPFAELFDVLIAVYHDQRLRHPSGHLYDPVERRMLEDAGERDGLLHRWLSQEIDLQKNSEFRPFLFEIELREQIDFGEHGIEPVKLRIDRVDGVIRGEVLECVVIDYKSSKSSVPTGPQIDKGWKTQLPLYARAIETYFAQRNISAIAVRGSYRTFGKSVRDAEDPREYEKLKDSKTADVHTQVDAILSLASSRIRIIRSANYPVTPLEKACDKCTAREICRIDHWDKLYEQ